MPEATQERQRRLSLGEFSRIAPGLYAWTATVVLPVLQPGVSSWARAMAVIALASLVASTLLLSTRPREARLLGVYGFSLACLGAWALLGQHLRPDQLDPVRGALGAVGFLLHALAWGAPPRPLESDVSDNLVPGAPLISRTKPVRTSPLALGAGVGVAFLPPAFAFAVERPETSLLAHATALGASLLIIAAATDVALTLGRARQVAPWRVRAGRAVWPLGGLTVALGLGLIWAAMR